MTEPVSQALVTQVWQEMASMPTDEAPALVERMQDEQPALLAYLLALEVYDLPQEEFEVILYLGIAVWQMMKRGHPRLLRDLDQKDRRGGRGKHQNPGLHGERQPRRFRERDAGNTGGIS